MNNRLAVSDRLLEQSISGFHQYTLGPVPQLRYVSENLCRMLGCGAEDLMCGGEDGYAARVHPDDRAAYDAFLAGAADGTMEYRLQRSDGSLCHVSDTMTVEQLADGTQLGSSVLTDLTELVKLREPLRFLNETIPCGFLRYTCQPQPRMTYINDRMLEMLGFPADGAGLELYRENIYLMIPMEERQRFARYLERVHAGDTPLAGEMAVQRYDGSRAYFFGWVTKIINEQGREEFQSACMDVTERYLAQKARQTERYLQALTEVYDLIFEFDREANTVRCIHSLETSRFRLIKNLPMQTEEAIRHWLSDTVPAADRVRVEQFFDRVMRREIQKEGAQPPQIRYMSKSSDGVLRPYSGLLLEMEEDRSLFCCRRMPEEQAKALRRENASLKNLNENMQELVLRFTDGLAAFEVSDGQVRPLYASENVCGFFGFSREEWLQKMQTTTPLWQFVSRSSTAYEDFTDLLENGEAEYSYRDLQSGTLRRVRAICSQKTTGSAPRYVMLYHVGEEQPEPRVRIRTFGYFDVFVDGKPIAFRNEKSKELFALLVDRRGGYVSSEEAIGYLWEDETANPVTLSRYRKVALRLKNLLEEYGISEVIESVNGKRRLVVDKVQCDLYDHLAGRDSQGFKGSYLSNYSWGERTLAELSGGSIF